MREAIEKSAVGGASPETRREIERHAASCSGCRAYLEAMTRDEAALSDYARSFEPSIEKVESESIEEAKRGVPGVETELPRSRRHGMVPRVAIYTAAAAALVAIAWSANQYTGLFGGKPAYAEVKRKVVTAKSVGYHQVIKMEGGIENPSDVLATDAGVERITMEGGGIVIMDFNKGVNLTILPAARTATVERRTGRKQGRGLFNSVDWVATLQDAPSGKLIGSEKLEGVDANVFLVPMTDFTTVKIWADAKTNLPVKIVWSMRHDPKLDVTMPAMVLSEGDFGGDKRFTTMMSMSNSAGMQSDWEFVYDNFKWNGKVDPALMSTTPPQGYTVRESETDVSKLGEKDLVDALSFWAEMSGKQFPTSIADLSDSAKVRPMLIRKFDRNGDPRTEFNEALKQAHVLLRGLTFSQGFKGEGTWHYAGAGVKLGDKSAAVCWWRPEGSRKYRVLYGDLHLADVPETDLPKTPR